MQSSSVCLSAPPRREACVTQGGSASAYLAFLTTPPPPTREMEPRASCMLSKSRHSSPYLLLNSSFPAAGSFILSGLFFSSLSRVHLTHVSKSEATLSGAHHLRFQRAKHASRFINSSADKEKESIS